MKILITGPESTGKTTIAEYIAQCFDGINIPEFARTYLEKNGPDYVEADLIFFAKEHIKIYNMQEPNTLQVFDTSNLDIVVWSLYKYGRCDPWIRGQTKQLDFDHIFLTSPDVPWTADSLRENENNRQDLYDLFVAELEGLGMEYTILESDRLEREGQVKEIIEAKIRSESS